MRSDHKRATTLRLDASVFFTDAPNQNFVVRSVDATAISKNFGYEAAVRPTESSSRYRVCNQNQIQSILGRKTVVRTCAERVRIPGHTLGDTT